MELSKWRFYCAGDEMNFSVYSDALCRARYLDSIWVHFGEARVDVYEIEPGLDSHWIVIKQRNPETESDEYKWFVRNGEKFVETGGDEVPKKLRAQVFHKLPCLAQRSGSLVA